MRRFYVLITATMIGLSAAYGLQKGEEHPSILEDIESDSLFIVEMEGEISELLEFNPMRKQEKKVGNIGYRVQVFSDNNVRTARNEARVKQRNIKARFPQYGSYVTYNSPYWRLRVGDFKTQEEANTALLAIRRAFPAYARELRVVRDRINVSKTE